jgi:hypothetical protein
MEALYMALQQLSTVKGLSDLEREAIVKNTYIIGGSMTANSFFSLFFSRFFVLIKLLFL